MIKLLYDEVGARVTFCFSWSIAGREDVMKGQLKELKKGGGISLKKYLNECKCGPTSLRAVPCNSLSHYEVSLYVAFRGQKLDEVQDENFPRLSTFYESYIGCFALPDLWVQWVMGKLAPTVSPILKL